MNSLGCFKDKDKLKQELLKVEHNTGKKLNMFVKKNPCLVGSSLLSFKYVN